MWADQATYKLCSAWWCTRVSTAKRWTTCPSCCAAGRPSRRTTAPLFGQLPPTCRTTDPAEHARPSCFCRRIQCTSSFVGRFTFQGLPATASHHNLQSGVWTNCLPASWKGMSRQCETLTRSRPQKHRSKSIGCRLLLQVTPRPCAVPKYSAAKTTAVEEALSALEAQSDNVLYKLTFTLRLTKES